MTLNVGDTRTVGGRKVTLVTVEPDENGEVVARTADGYYTLIKPDAIDPERPRFRVDTPYGQVTVDLPVDGHAEVRAVWSQAAVDRTAGTLEASA